MRIQKPRAKRRRPGPGRPAFRPSGRRAARAQGVLGDARRARGQAPGGRRLVPCRNSYSSSTARGAMRDGNPAAARPRKGGRRKWVRHEREYSNSMWHADFKRLHDGRWLVSYMDDASRFITGFGAFPDATAENALAVLERAVADHGKPSSILTGRGPQFCSSESGGKGRGPSRFETELAAMGIRQILRGAGHPLTSGKLWRFHGEVQRWLPTFVEESAERTARRGVPGGHVGDIFHAAGRRDPVTRLVDWYNNDRTHESLDLESAETPAMAFARRMPASAGADEGGESGA